MNDPPWRRTAGVITANWATGPGGIAHNLTPGGLAACDPGISLHWSDTSYWKSDMPEGIRPCARCEAVLAGKT